MNDIEFKICDIQGRLFESFANTEYNAESLVKNFMCGELSKNLDSSYNHMQWVGEEYLLEELISTYKPLLELKQIDISGEALYWMGYVYRYWHYYTGEDSKKIYKQASFKTMNINYFMFHAMDAEMAIDDLKEIYKQKKHK